MIHTWKNESAHLEKWFTIRKKGHTWKNGSQLENWLPLGVVRGVVGGGGVGGGSLFNFPVCSNRGRLSERYDPNNTIFCCLRNVANLLAESWIT